MTATGTPSPPPIELHPIGVIRTAFTQAAGTPIQPVYASGQEGRVILDAAYADALTDIEGFERLWLIYWLDRVSGFETRVIPYRDTREHGLFATRSPRRPNRIGMSVVRLLRRDGDELIIDGADILDGTPLIDIKPYVPEFDAYPDSRAGWLEAAGADRRTADERFHGDDG